ncbi:MAG TPA: trypsin-like peptidase domain-containing protein [Bryobacteraceae bacterium]|jgi:serine protease Do|nr:trypsin-like peptidase domain-containing protein [Bryobacteraceae bacterium]
MPTSSRLTTILIVFTCTAFGQKTAPSRPTVDKPVTRIDALHDLSTQLEELAHRVDVSVVQIFSTGYVLSDDRSSSGSNAAIVTRQHASGSGVIVSADGFIVTNAHVVSNARSVRVRIAGAPSGDDAGSMAPSGKMLPATVVGMDRDTDLAVIRVDRTDLTPLALGDSDSLHQGQLVMAFGNPLGLENSVSMGVVSSVARQVKPEDTMLYIQTDAPINPGNSGGPLVNADGKVMGLNTFILSQSGGSEGLGFAIPSNLVRNVYQQIRQEGHVHRSEIGVLAQTITPQLASGLSLPRDWGVLLSDVDPGGPGDVGGLKPGDIVLSLNGKAEANARQLEVDLYRYPVGAKVDVEILRNGERKTVQVATIERQGDPERFADMVDPTKNLVRRLGILGIDVDQKVAALLPDLRRHYGVVVAARGGDSPYSGDTLQLGDVIYEINKAQVTDVDALRKQLDALKDADSLVLLVERDGHLLYVTMEVE